MGYRGKLDERSRARDLRAQGWVMRDIAEHLGVSRSSVSLWTRDVPFSPDLERTRERRHRARQRGPNVLQRRKQAEIDRLLAEGAARIGDLSERDFLITGVALYAGEGSKTDGVIALANTDPRFIAFFCAWLRHFFPVDESRLRVFLYLHEGLDLAAAIDFWSALTAVPPSGSASRTVRSPTVASATRSTCLGAPPFVTPAAPAIARSWDWSTVSWRDPRR